MKSFFQLFLRINWKFCCLVQINKILIIQINYVNIVYLIILIILNVKKLYFSEKEQQWTYEILLENVFFNQNIKITKYY